MNPKRKRVVTSAVVVACAIVVGLILIRCFDNDETGGNPGLTNSATHGSNATMLRVGDLTNNVLGNRKYVQELGQPRNEEAIATLRAVFDENRKVAWGKADPCLDAEIILALGSIGGSNAFAAARDIITDVRRTGPQSDSVYERENLRYETTMRTAVRTLALNGSRESLAMLADIESDPAMDQTVRRDSYRWLLVEEMRAAETQSVESQVKWLTDRYNQEVDDDIEPYKVVALDFMLTKMGAAALPTLAKIKQAWQEDPTRVRRVPWINNVIRRIESCSEDGQVPPEPGLPTWRIE